MNAIARFSFIVMILVSCSTLAEQFGPYNQKFTYNQQFSSGNWYSSPLGQGAAMAGVAIISGLVNAMSRPDPVVVVSPNQQYQQQPQSYKQQVSNNGNCSMQTLYDRSGNPRYVKICD